MIDWIKNSYQLLIGIFGWPLLGGLFLLTRKTVFRKWGKPLVVFEGPIIEDSSFGRTYYLSVKNESLSKIKKAICPRRALEECHIEASFFVKPGLTQQYSWWTDPDLTPNGITLLPNSRIHTFDFVTKNQGSSICNIGTVAVEENERLPENCTIDVTVKLFNGNEEISSSRWNVKNQGIDLTEFQISRIVEPEIIRIEVKRPSRYRIMSWFARIIPGLISLITILDAAIHGWFHALDMGGWFMGSAGAFVLAIESLWVLKSEPNADDKTSRKTNIETVQLGLFLLLLGFLLVSISKIVNILHPST
jgi:hypothetical protein